MAKREALSFQRLSTARPTRKISAYTTNATQDIFLFIIRLATDPVLDSVTIVEGNEFRVIHAEGDTVDWAGGIPPFTVRVAYRNPTSGAYTFDTTGMNVNIDDYLTNGTGFEVTERTLMVEKRSGYSGDGWWADDLQTDDYVEGDTDAIKIQCHENSIGIHIQDNSPTPREIFAPFAPDPTFLNDLGDKSGIYAKYPTGSFGPPLSCYPPVYAGVYDEVTIGDTLHLLSTGVAWIPGTRGAENILAGEWTYAMDEGYTIPLDNFVPPAPDPAIPIYWRFVPTDTFHYNTVAGVIYVKVNAITVGDIAVNGFAQVNNDHIIPTENDIAVAGAVVLAGDVSFTLNSNVAANGASILVGTVSFSLTGNVASAGTAALNIDDSIVCTGNAATVGQAVVNMDVSFLSYTNIATVGVSAHSLDTNMALAGDIAVDGLAVLNEIISLALYGSFASTGSATFSYSESKNLSGNISVDGHAQLNNDNVYISYGDIASTGSALLGADVSFTLLGSTAISGQATRNISINKTLTGSFTSTGSAVLNADKLMQLEGSVASKGQAALSGIVSMTRSGSVATSGAAVTSFNRILVNTGNAAVQGAAEVNLYSIKNLSGNIALEGHANLNNDNIENLYGNVAIEGAVTLSGDRLFSLSGLIAVNGRAEYNIDDSRDVSGDIAANGTLVMASFCIIEENGYTLYGDPLVMRLFANVGGVWHIFLPGGVELTYSFAGAMDTIVEHTQPIDVLGSPHAITAIFRPTIDPDFNEMTFETTLQIEPAEIMVAWFPELKTIEHGDLYSTIMDATVSVKDRPSIPATGFTLTYERPYYDTGGTVYTQMLPTYAIVIEKGYGYEDMQSYQVAVSAVVAGNPNFLSGTVRTTKLIYVNKIPVNVYAYLPAPNPRPYSSTPPALAATFSGVIVSKIPYIDFDTSRLTHVPSGDEPGTYTITAATMELYSTNCSIASFTYAPYTIIKAQQTIGMPYVNWPKDQFGDNIINVGSTGTIGMNITGAGTSPIVFSSSNPFLYEVVGSVITVKATGYFSIYANKSSDARYEAAAQKGVQYYSGAAKPVHIVFSNTSKTYDGLASGVTAVLRNDLTNTVVAGTITFQYEGSSTVPSQTGNYNVVALAVYANGTLSSSTTYTILKAYPVVTFDSELNPGELPPANYGEPIGYRLDATAVNASGVELQGTYSYSDGITAASILPYGTYVIVVTFTPTDSVNWHTVTQSAAFTVMKGTQVINGLAFTAPLVYGTALSGKKGQFGAMTYLSTSSGNAVTMSSSNPANCEVVGNYVWFKVQSTITLTLFVAESADYYSLTKNITLTIAASNYSMSFIENPDFVAELIQTNLGSNLLVTGCQGYPEFRSATILGNIIPTVNTFVLPVGQQSQDVSVVAIWNPTGTDTSKGRFAIGGTISVYKPNPLGAVQAYVDFSAGLVGNGTVQNSNIGKMSDLYNPALITVVDGNDVNIKSSGTLSFKLSAGGGHPEQWIPDYLWDAAVWDSNWTGAFMITCIWEPFNPELYIGNFDTTYFEFIAPAAWVLVFDYPTAIISHQSYAKSGGYFASELTPRFDVYITHYWNAQQLAVRLYDLRVMAGNESPYQVFQSYSTYDFGYQINIFGNNFVVQPIYHPQGTYPGLSTSFILWIGRWWDYQ